MIRLTRSTSVSSTSVYSRSARLRAELALQQLDGAADGAERVADLVGEADRHAAGGRQGLAAPHLRLELADPREIAHDGHRRLGTAPRGRRAAPSRC